MKQNSDHAPITDSSTDADAAPVADHAEQAHATTSLYSVTEPTLFLVPTPLGNLGDVSPRARAVLQQVDRVAAEDTRTTGKLLELLGIRQRLLACHEHNEAQAAEHILGCLKNGESIALVSDAGTPAVSDPGARVVARVAAQGFAVVPVPGPSSVVVAVCASGLVDADFYFRGFVPAKGAARQQALKAAVAMHCPVVFFEAPHRILDLLEALIALGQADRPLCVCRELTKRFEQFYRGTVAQVLASMQADPNAQRGEFVVVLGTQASESLDSGEGDTPALQQARALTAVLSEHLPTKAASSIAADFFGQPKKVLYQYALSLKNGADPASSD